eukprot:2119970-Alexandrium_andersonii.AAC.1
MPRQGLSGRRGRLPLYKQGEVAQPGLRRYSSALERLGELGRNGARTRRRRGDLANACERG